MYLAVVKAGGTFRDGYDTATFFVSDLGLHLRVYRDNVLLHVASLRDGTPVAASTWRSATKPARSQLKASTDADGNALLAYKIEASDVLVARHGKDVSVLPFNRPALDVSNFDITGRDRRRSRSMRGPAATCTARARPCACRRCCATTTASR